MQRGKTHEQLTPALMQRGFIHKQDGQTNTFKDHIMLEEAIRCLKSVMETLKIQDQTFLKYILMGMLLRELGHLNR